MSELKAALETILRVNFREPVPANDAARLADFLHRSAQELLRREEDVGLREEVVSARESAATLREDTVTKQLDALGSMGRLAKTLELKPVKGSRRWLTRS